MSRSPSSPTASPWLLPALIATFSASPIPALTGEFREFTNHAGQKLRAAIVSATEQEVTLKREDGSQITGGISFFSAADQSHIEDWRKANPAQQAYDFSIDASRQRVGRTKTNEGNLIVVYETWKFSIKVENRSKAGSAGAPVEGLELAYNLSKTAKSKAVQSAMLHDDLVPAGGLLIKAGTVNVGTIEYLRSKTVETDTIAVNHSELAPGWYYTDGSRDEHNDTLEGITVQLRKDGKVIAQKTLGSKAATGAKWIEPGASAAPKR